MNDALIFKMIRPFLSIEKVQDFVTWITGEALKERDKRLNPGEDPSNLIGIASFRADNEIIIAFARIDENFKITEVLEPETLTNVAAKILKNL